MFNDPKKTAMNRIGRCGPTFSNDLDRQFSFWWYYFGPVRMLYNI